MELTGSFLAIFAAVVPIRERRARKPFDFY
jgi:hypothetical protein